MKIDTTTWLCGPPSKKGRKQKYPSRFIFNLKKYYPKIFNKDKKVLEMFSGSSDIGVTTDINKDSDSDYICDFREIPIKDNTFDFIIADPPYADHYAKEWNTELPKPKHILKEASRLVKPNGLIFILHIIIIPAYKEFDVNRIALHPILAGPNNALRVLNVFIKTKNENRSKEN